MRTLLSTSLAILVAAAVPAAAQIRAGGEFQVNSYTTAYQGLPTASMAKDGSFVIVWTSFPGQDGSLAGVFGQRYDAAGARRDAEFQVNTWTTGNQSFADLQAGVFLPPSIAHDRRGRFVVTWTSDTHAADPVMGVFGRRYASDLVAPGAEFRVNAYTSGLQFFNEVAVSPSGTIVTVWAGQGAGGDQQDVFGRMVDARGAPMGGDFRVNTYAGATEDAPHVAAAGDGGFVVVWESDRYGLLDVFGQRFSATGTALGAEFRVNTTTTDDQAVPNVAADRAGNFVVAWNHWTANALNPVDVFAQRYAAGGQALGGEFRVNGGTALYQFYPSVAADEPGNFVVAWFGVGAGDTIGVFGQRFSASGARRGAEFMVNTFTTDYQALPAVGADLAGNFVVSWTSLAPQDGNLAGAFAQRFGGLVPAAISVDALANNVLEPGETGVVRPSWRNVNGASQTFAGSAVGFTGPAAPGVTYSVPDGTGDYGTVANGATASCTDCYSVGLTFGGTRPATHWDGVLEERLTPDAQGQDKLWTMHVGGSFTDVPANNAFYRFIETLLHHGITAGCTPTEYCPGDPVLRGQMSVFVLVASEGGGYAPPACTTPLFADVPAASPFCRFIEELARRGVVAGCGGGNFCPGTPVTREQMAVFVLRTLDPALTPPACTTPVFADVPASSPFCRWIEELARRGVVTGCGAGNYCPTAPITREQMAVFIVVTFGLSLYGP